MVFFANRITRRLQIMAAGWLVPASVWGWLPKAEEWLALCRQAQWEQAAQPLLAEPDEAIRQWLQEPIDEWGHTPLHVCAHEGNVGLLSQLLLRVRPEEWQTLMTVVDKHGDTPLQRAVCNSNPEVTQCLLAHGASVTAINNSGSTSLHIVAYNGHLQVAQCLLAHGAPVTAINKSSSTSLHWAAYGGHLQVAQCLLAHGASATAVDNRGHLPLHWAIFKRHKDIETLLGNPPKPVFTPPSLQYMSCFAVWRSAGRIDRLQQWLQASPLPPLQTIVLLSTLGFSRYTQTK